MTACSMVIPVPSLARDPKVLQLARDLGLSVRGDALRAIREHALHQVHEVIQASPIPVDSLERLRRVLANKFRVQLELVVTDEDVGRIAADQADFSLHLRTRLTEEFLEGATEGITLQRDDFDPMRNRFLVVVDARAERAPRAYFTTWHELAHLLIYPQQLPIPGFRRSPSVIEVAKDPIEQVVDHIAGHAAFYEPLFRPAVSKAIGGHDGFCFAAIEAARTIAGIPGASLQATAIQMVQYAHLPTLLVAADHVLKRTERRRLHSPQGDLGLAPAPMPIPQLRVTTCVPNAAAKASDFEIRQNMRVPARSVLSTAALSQVDGTWIAREDQGWWSTSSKGPLSSIPITVEATRRGRFVYGIVVKAIGS